MKEKKKILLDLLSMIEALELSREDYAEFARELMKHFGLSLTDCFPTDQTAALLQEVQTKCNELLLLTTKLPVAGVNDACNGKNATETTAAAEVVSEKTAGLSETAASANGNHAVMSGQAIVATDNIPIEDENGIVGYVVGTKTENEKVISPVSSPYPKGYSRNGRKLGRPRKQKTNEEQAPAASASRDTSASEKTEDTTDGTDAEASATAGENSGATGTEPVQMPDASAVTEGDDFSEAERNEIEKLKMGKVYSMDILYRWKKRLVVSNRVMQDATPLGIFVPYKRRAAGYARFILAATDEIAGLPVSKAQKYARNQLPPYEGEKWDVLNSWQIEAAKQAQPELNQMLKKVGGDPFVGLYLAPKSVNYHEMPDKIRYAVNVGKL